MNDKVKKLLYRIIIALTAIGAALAFYLVRRKLLPTIAAQRVLQSMMPGRSQDHFTQAQIDATFMTHAGEVEAMTRELEKKEVEEIKLMFHEAFGRSK